MPASASLPRDTEFFTWLELNTSLATRSRQSVVSRARRAHNMSKLAGTATAAEVVFRLTQHPSFAQCSPSVQSQLKRAARLYLEFITNR